MHALLYMVVSLLAVAVVFYVLGAPFAAALEVIVYAGAIMVLFVFVIMMLILGKNATERERDWLAPRIWIGPSMLARRAACGACLRARAGGAPAPRSARSWTRAASVRCCSAPICSPSKSASMLLLAGLVGAYRLGRG